MAEKEAERIAALCSRVLHQNWREGEQGGKHYGFTAPSPGHYDWQWYWDSCFHAIIWRRLDPARSRLELETLLASSQDGFIGHTNFLGKTLNLERAIRYNIASRHASATSTIQPPVLAWAWSIAIGDPSTEPRIRAHHDWLRAHRDLEGDNLLWLIQPDESGMDASPKFDRLGSSAPAEGAVLSPRAARSPVLARYHSLVAYHRPPPGVIEPACSPRAVRSSWAPHIPDRRAGTHRP